MIDGFVSSLSYSIDTSQSFLLFEKHYNFNAEIQDINSPEASGELSESGNSTLYESDYWVFSDRSIQ